MTHSLLASQCFFRIKRDVFAELVVKEKVSEGELYVVASIIKEKREGVNPVHCPLHGACGGQLDSNVDLASLRDLLNGHGVFPELDGLSILSIGLKNLLQLLM